MNSDCNFFYNFYSINNIFKKLLDFYHYRYWWPAESPLEVMEGAVLAQNTAWKNAEISVKRIKNIEPEILLNMKDEIIKELIKEAGFQSKKIEYLRNIIIFYIFNINNSPDFSDIRNDLLKIRGVGKETADSISLYAFNQRTFPVDSYTIRFFNRYFSLNLTQKDYDCIHKHVSKIFNTLNLMEFHALIDEHSKKYCKKSPLCGNCFLRDNCSFNEQYRTQ